MWLSFEQVTLRYERGAPVLTDVTFRVSSGLWQVVGPNGAGKSSLLRCAAGLLRPSAGSLCFDGEDVWSNAPAYRWRLGYAPQDVEELPDLPAGRYLAYLAALKGIRPEYQQSRAKEMLRTFALPDRSLPGYSAGMKRRLAQAAAMLNDPDVLLLDEPSAGLDPQEKVWLWLYLAQLAQERIILLATCVPEESAHLASGRLAVMNGSVTCHADSHRAPFQDLSGALLSPR